MSYWDNEIECAERRIDSDLPYAIQATLDLKGFQLEDVAYVLATITGENDGPSWHWIISMKDHTYAYVTGGCDYTGWGCQDWGDVSLFPTLREALAAVEKPHRDILRKQLTGSIPHGADS